ncbi:MAG: methyltransferase domain-containing protein [Caulobacter sp.]|nr:methyltransferase domain-containing protein [Caulobacter sp.]
MISRRAVLLMGSALALSAGASAADAGDAVLRDVLAGSQRAASHQARDDQRHPYESLLFWGLKPGLSMIELSPGTGYWTEILAPYARMTGGVFGVGVTDLADASVSDRGRKARAAFEARYADRTVFGDIRYLDFGPRSAPLGPPGSVDLVLTARNIHNWLEPKGHLDKVMADVFAVLKPGGLLAVEEHRSDPLPQAPGAPTGYMSTDFVIAAAARAGFRLDGRSEINANPRDNKTHPYGVWTLPPVRRAPAAGETPPKGYDRAAYDAIGESDRMTLRFVKPS